MWRVCDPIQDTMVEDCLEAGRCVHKLWSHHPQVTLGGLWAVYYLQSASQLTCEAAMIWSQSNDRWSIFMALWSLSPWVVHHLMSCQDRRSSAWAAAWHAMSPEVEVCGLVMSLSRFSGCFDGIVREFEWILNLQKHTKTHQPQQPQQPHHNHFDKFSGDFVPKKKALQKFAKHINKNIPPFDGQAQAAVLPRLLLVRDPTDFLVASLLRGVSFFFLVCGLKSFKEAAIEQLGELEKLDRCTED